jgi:hypothetical protein
MRRDVLQFFGLLALIGAGGAVLFGGFYLSFSKQNCGTAAKPDCHVPLVLAGAGVAAVLLLAVGLIVLRLVAVADQRRRP